MKKYIIIIVSILIFIIIGFLLIYSQITYNQDIVENDNIEQFYVDENTTIPEINQEENEKPHVDRKPAYYDENGFVNDNIYIDCQIYSNFEEANIKSIIDSRIEEIKDKILSEPPNTSGMVVINLSANTHLYEGINVLYYTENYRRYKMLKTYFDETFHPDIMDESNKGENTNIFNVDLENNKNISNEAEDITIYYSVKTGQKIVGVSDLFSSNYDYVKKIKERVKYMLDLNFGYSESEVTKRVDEAYKNLDIGIDLLKEKLIISLEDDGFEMFFDEFDKSQMTIY